MKVEYGQLIPDEDNEDENLHPKGQGGDGSNQIKMKVRALFLKLCAAMPYIMAFFVARGAPSLAIFAT